MIDFASYVNLDCPRCGRHRVEHPGELSDLHCEKCGLAGDEFCERYSDHANIAEARGITKGRASMLTEVCDWLAEDGHAARAWDVTKHFEQPQMKAWLESKGWEEKHGHWYKDDWDMSHEQAVEHWKGDLVARPETYQDAMRQAGWTLHEWRGEVRLIEFAQTKQGVEWLHVDTGAVIPDTTIQRAWPEWRPRKDGSFWANLDFFATQEHGTVDVATATQLTQRYSDAAHPETEAQEEPEWDRLRRRAEALEYAGERLRDQADILDPEVDLSNSEGDDAS